MVPKIEFKFKNNQYTKKRGTPAMLIILCIGCNAYLMHYQKDGPGPLLRCYFDRIHYPKSLKNLQHTILKKQGASNLVCPLCAVVIGNPILYEKEKRLAYHMRKGFFSFSTLITNLNSPTHKNDY